MNILPLILVALLIFSCLCTSFMKEIKGQFVIESSLEGFRKTERVVRNRFAKRSYARIKTEQTKSHSSLPKAASPFYSRRTPLPPAENSKLNLTPLLSCKTEPKRHPLYEIAASLIKELYQVPLFSRQKAPEGIEYTLLDAWIKQARNVKELESFSALYPEAADLKKLHYKVLKGTNQYDPATHVGIPPLSDFFSLEKEKSPAIHFTFASLPLLKALFQEDLAIEILKEEKKKWEKTGTISSLTKEELNALFINDTKCNTLLTSLEPYINYTSQITSRKAITGKDPRTGITVRHNY
jgi:hypothetical protein